MLLFRSPAISLCQVLFSPRHVCASHNPLSVHTFVPWQGLILLPPWQAAQRQRGKDLGASPPFLFSPFPSLSFPTLLPCPPFPTPHMLSSQFAMSQGTGFAVSSLLLGFCRTRQRRKALRCRGSAPQRRWLGEQPCSCHGDMQLLQEKRTYCFPLFFSGSVSAYL